MDKAFEKRALSSTFANVLLFLTHLAQSILVVPYLLEYWGKDKYGVWLAIYAFFTLVQVFDLGHQTYVGNEFNKYYHSDKSKAQEIIASGIITSLFIAIFELIIVAIILFLGFGYSLVGIPLNFSEPNAIWGLLILVGMWALAGSVGGLLVRMILPLGLIHRFIYISLIIKIANIALLLFASFYQWSIFNLCLSFSIIYLFYSYGVYFYIYKIMPDFFPWWKSATFSVGWKNFTRSMVITSNNFLEQFSTNGLIIIISNFMGATLIPAFTTMRTVTNTALQGTGMIINPIYPDMIRFHTHHEFDKLLQIFVTNWLITGLLVNMSFVFSLALIEPLYIWWTRGLIPFDFLLYYWLVFAVLVANYNRGMITYLSGMNQLKAMSFISVTRFIITAGVSLAFIQSYNLLALGWALVAAELACTGWIVWFTQILLKTIGEAMPLKIVYIAALPVFIAGLCMGCHAYQLLPAWIIICVGLTSMMLVYAYFTKFVSFEVRKRFHNLIVNKFQ